MLKKNRNISGLLKSAKEKNRKTLSHVNKTLKEMIIRNEMITFSHVATQAQVSRSWLYKNNKIRMEIETTRALQEQKKPINSNIKKNPNPTRIISKLEKQIEQLKEKNRKLTEQLEAIYGKIVENDH